MAKEQSEPRLPGMEDPAIEELEDGAKQYAKVRDKRMALLEQEVELKGRLTAAMKKLKRTTYVHGKITINLVTEEETVKVKIQKDDDDKD